MKSIADNITKLLGRTKIASLAAVKIAACLVLAAAAVLSANPQHDTALAATSITLTPSVQFSFPNTMTFKISAQSDANITRLRLHYIVNRQNSAKVVSEGWASFTPAASVNTQWVWDMRKSSLPPGAQVEYWWTALDSSGKTGETSHQTTTFDDDRHSWQSTTSGQITIQWYNGSQSFADALMTAAQQGLQRIENNVGAIPQGQVKIYIYASSQDLQAAQLFAPQWEGGATFDSYNLIAIGVSTNELGFGQRAVPHELTHWVVGQITFNNYGAGLPTWLSEGLATYGESTTLNPQYQSALNGAIQNNQLLSVRTLSSPFSAVSSVAYISYGESNSIVNFMVDKYGKDKMIQLLKVFGQGAGYDEALRQVYGFDQDGLDALWRQSLGIKTSAFLPNFMPELVPVG